MDLDDLESGEPEEPEAGASESAPSDGRKIDPRTFASLGFNMDAITKNLGASVLRAADMSRLAQPPSIPPPIRRPDLEVLADIRDSQEKQEAALFQMAKGIGQLADFAQSESRRDAVEGRKNTALILLTVAIVLLAAATLAAILA